MDNSTLRDALLHRGISFEKQIVNKLSNVIDCTGKPPSKAREILRTANVGDILYQLKMEVSDKFHEELGIKDIVRLKPFIPDFIKVVEEDGEKRLMILDAKASKDARVSHQFQVASYAYLLNYVLRRIRGLEVSRTGGIYLPPFELQTFRMDFLLPKIDRFFRIELPRIISASSVPWHYNARCKTCEFVNDCRKDADGTMSMIPYLSVEKAADLKMFVQDWKVGDTLIQEADNSIDQNKKVDNEADIEDLARYFDTLNINFSKDENTNNPNFLIDRKIKQIVKYDYDIKKSPYLEAFETRKAQFIGIPTTTFPQKTDHNLVISMSLDPFTCHPFAWGICLFSSDGKVVKNFQHSESISKLKEDETHATFVSLIDKFVTRLEKAFEYLSRKKSCACVFVFSEQEKIIIQDSLLEIISLDPDTISAATQHTAARCLFNLFEDCSMLLVSGNHSEGSVTELPNEWREFPRLVILEDAIRENIAMYVPGFYRFQDIWEQMVRDTIKDEDLHNTLDSEINSIDLEDIYAIWVSSSEVAEYEINNAHKFRTYFENAVIQAYYELLAHSQYDIKSKLLFSPPPFNFTEVRAFRHHYLGKLYFFKQFEAVTSCSQQRYGRIKDFIYGDVFSGLRLKLDKFLKKEGSEWVASFEILSGGNEVGTFESKTFKEFILVDDSQEGVMEAIRFPDMKFQDKFYGFPLSVLSIVGVNENDPLHRFIHLKGIYKKNMKADSSSIYRLYKRYLDFNLNKVLKMLVEIDEREDERSVFLDVLKDPNKWGSSLSLENESKEIKSMALELRDLFGMSPSQKNISAKLLDRRLQIVWGPPGSGKTHFLALFLTWYLTSLRPKPTDNNKNFLVGITAFTRAAIDNLMNRIFKVQKEKHKTSDFSLIRLVKDVRKELTDGMCECKAETLPKKINDVKIGIPGNPIIIGGTVWDWYKVRNEWKNDWKGCDIMIIDEGSQLLVSDACIALECLNQDRGRLIVAGDHMQCLMRRENGSVFKEEDFFLKQGQKHNFGPSTIQLPDNWRMNEELNNFFQKIYGDDYKSTQPMLKLDFADPKLKHIDNLHIKNSLSPDKAIVMVKISLTDYEPPKDFRYPASGLLSEQFLRTEADVVSQIVTAYFDSPKKKRPQSIIPSLFVVTPHHRQRHAIKSRLQKYITDSSVNLQINTVEKMQGQEADIVIACFGFLDVNEISREFEFLFDRNRWNVAISRAKCKVIVITTDEMLYPRGMEIFANKKTSEGWVFLSMIEKWVQEGKGKRKKKNSGLIEWVVGNEPSAKDNETSSNDATTI
ncbi:2545_t:CDS:10 [Diversispora eburnea]|uniref:2545_t:CDS:1 n=1 Tax=Diversispora eburnea TaxID=1213867 RepID=A0A9N8ZR57_9GLOM|nr:2545_t:CDS:10 [Diversispora eburnea]